METKYAAVRINTQDDDVIIDKLVIFTTKKKAEAFIKADAARMKKATVKEAKESGEDWNQIQLFERDDIKGTVLSLQDDNWAFQWEMIELCEDGRDLKASWMLEAD